MWCSTFRQLPVLQCHHYRRTDRKSQFPTRLFPWEQTTKKRTDRCAFLRRCMKKRMFSARTLHEAGARARSAERRTLRSIFRDDSEAPYVRWGTLRERPAGAAFPSLDRDADFSARGQDSRVPARPLRTPGRLSGRKAASCR